MFCCNYTCVVFLQHRRNIVILKRLIVRKTVKLGQDGVLYVDRKQHAVKIRFLYLIFSGHFVSTTMLVLSH